MDLELVALGKYGQFVWPAFIFSFACCFYLYLKTKKELQKQEKMFLTKFNHKSVVKAKVSKQKEILKEVLSSNISF